jgi:hypothetical protein
VRVKRRINKITWDVVNREIRNRKKFFWGGRSKWCDFEGGWRVIIYFEVGRLMVIVNK